MIQTIFLGSKNRESGQPGEGDHTLPNDRMTTRIPLTVIKTNARERWHGMSWERYGNAAGSSYMDIEFEDRRAWLDQTCPQGWCICTEVFMGKLPTAAEAHAGQVQQVTMGVSLCFSDPGYAVLYKLTWGNHE